MKEPENFSINGPSYKDQMYTKYLETKEKYDCKYFNRIWDACQQQCEYVHNERLRNKLSPLVNLISINENIINNQEDKDTFIEWIDKYNWIDRCNNSVEQILDITNQ